MSRLDSLQYEMRSAIVDGRSTVTKIFAKYGARNVETGPIQFLKSKLLRSIRPFNPGVWDGSRDELLTACCSVCLTHTGRLLLLFLLLLRENQDAEIRISYDEASHQVAITSCASELVSESSTDGFTNVQCATKWEGKFE